MGHGLKALLDIDSLGSLNDQVESGHWTGVLDGNRRSGIGQM
jgi:hypothetical protein